ncbi:RluA family pseudouridine synthase [Levilactobacillus tujiorum]|uniref:Pseudouridine synthase n=1 Tax=Levilactobacillus tujiorum TaxID=2912243 RepID=A0ABX1L0Y4_9LACO|nr:RluA family pseudouridine synthase [Levilactobacillus tujiorum]MCH5463691.1 RluA family pseudouridine synthase [Levilactobacillus tujiorum]NLR10897.1 RluA family pseudouridine synthase [Lactobacillus sp. HBUAS51387]NLR28678.1 RluA family pseudouridine synthase [Levilactobacillus tujiorum]NLR32459.1 RluA family pseudouridine synthase [Levilactobacillus tujiorum]
MQIEDFTVQAVARLDKLVAETVPTISRSQAKNAIEAGQITVDGQPARPKDKPAVGAQIHIELPDPQPLDLTPENIPLDIVYEDDDVIVVNKPQGMVVHPAPGHPNHTLVNALLYHSPLSSINGTLRPGIVHRIDKDTSGLLMVAKNDHAHHSLSEQLQAKTNLREYVAIVHGNFKEEEGVIRAPLGRSPKDRKKQAVVADGRPAVTHFRVLERYGTYTLIACRLETGRTHQIRVHMAYINHPVAGDPLYGPKKTLKGEGQFLHARELGFVQPTTGEQLDFTAPVPAHFAAVVKKLRREAGLPVDKAI